MAEQFEIPPEVVAQVKSGALPPSAYSPFLAPLHGRHVIGINNAYQLGTWIDVCFFGDYGWYLVHRERLARWPNLKVSCPKNDDQIAQYDREGVKSLSRRGGHGIDGSPERLYGISSDPSKVAWNHNSGAAAVSLAAHFGVRRIVLLGFDMHAKKSFHWHKGHGNKPPRSFERHLRGFPAIKEDADRMGIEILNSSPQSSIEVFPKVNIKEVLH